MCGRPLHFVGPNSSIVVTEEKKDVRSLMALHESSLSKASKKLSEAFASNPATHVGESDGEGAWHGFGMLVMGRSVLISSNDMLLLSLLRHDGVEDVFFRRPH